MPRITVNVTEESEAWLESQTDALGVSKARVGGHCIGVMQNTVQHIDLQRDSLQQSEVPTPPDVNDLRVRLAELEGRVAELETTAEQPAADRLTPKHTGDAGAAPSDASHTPAEESRSALSDADTGDAVIEDVLDGWRPGRSQEKREQQRAAGRAALAFLHEQDIATAAEFREQVEPQYPVDDQSPATWWKNSARPALQRAREADLVAFKDGVKEWRWTADT